VKDRKVFESNTSHYYFSNPNTTWAAQRLNPGFRGEKSMAGKVIYIEFVVEEIYYLSKLILMGTMSKQL